MEQTVIQWLVDHWTAVVAGAYVADKIVKATPTKKDDFVVDVLLGLIKKLAGKRIR